MTKAKKATKVLSLREFRSVLLALGACGSGVDRLKLADTSAGVYKKLVQLASRSKDYTIASGHLEWLLDIVEGIECRATSECHHGEAKYPHGLSGKPFIANVLAQMPWKRVQAALFVKLVEVKAARKEQDRLDRVYKAKQAAATAYLAKRRERWAERKDSANARRRALAAQNRATFGGFQIPRTFSFLSDSGYGAF